MGPAVTDRIVSTRVETCQWRRRGHVNFCFRYVTFCNDWAGKNNSEQMAEIPTNIVKPILPSIVHPFKCGKFKWITHQIALLFLCSLMFVFFLWSANDTYMHLICTSASELWALKTKIFNAMLLSICESNS